MKKYLALLAALLVPAAASAHVKWFVDSDAVTRAEHGLVPFYYLTSAEVVTWAAIAAIVVAVAGLLSRLLPEPRKLLSFANRNRGKISHAAQALVGLFLVIVGIWWQVVLVPEFPVVDAYGRYLQAAEVISGLLLLANVWPRVGGGLLLALCAAVGWHVGFGAFAENLLLVGLAFYFLVNDSPKGSPLHRCDSYGVEAVRLTVGVSLIVLAVTEKLMYPELSLAFLGAYHWNFMPALGFTWFTDKLFVLSTGFAELIFGAVFLLGYVTRINTAVIAAFFATSVVTMAVSAGQWEIEDLPVYAAAIILICHGAGATRFFCKRARC